MVTVGDAGAAPIQAAPVSDNHDQTAGLGSGDCVVESAGAGHPEGPDGLRLAGPGHAPGQVAADQALVEVLAAGGFASEGRGSGTGAELSEVAQGGSSFVTGAGGADFSPTTSVADICAVRSSWLAAAMRIEALPAC